MKALLTDLDNTLIYSYKHDIGNNKQNVELYQGREISFITEKTFRLLQEVKERMLIVPLSTRTVEQYERIDLGIGNIKYALVCNGGILLENGKRNEEWYKDSLKLIEKSNDAVNRAIEILEKEEERYFEIRHIEKLFVFTKCHNPERVVDKLKEALDSSIVDVFNNGDKVYVVPKNLDKGTAAKRICDYLEIETCIAAGDSEFDIPMLAYAKTSYAPYGFEERYNVETGAEETEENAVFSDSFLNKILQKEKQ